MAYITAQEVAQIRNALKARFNAEGYRFSVRRSNCHAIEVDIMQSPVRFEYTDEAQRLARARYGSNDPQAVSGTVNHYHLHQYKQRAFFEEVLKIIRYASDNKWFDESDSMTDYFNTAFYIHIGVGKWDKPCVYI